MYNIIKPLRVISLLALIMFLASCQRELDWSGAPDIKAKVETESKTRTSLSVDESGAGTIYWNPSDKIDVFFGTTKASYTSQNTSDAETAVFKTTDFVGGADISSNNIWGLYPARSSSRCDGNAVTTVLPSTQKGVPDTFDDDLFLAVAHSSSTNLQFYNVCGGIRFNLAYDDIKKVTFSGNNGEDLAGDVSITFENGVPKATVVNGIKEITLTPKTGNTFTKGTDYYITLLPCTLSAGFTMTFTTTDGSVAMFNYSESSVTIKRSIFSKKGNIDVYASFGDQRRSNNVIYYTSSDGNIVTPTKADSFGANLVSNDYADGRGVMTFDGDITAIGPYAFRQCSTLTAIDLPSSVLSIEQRAFASCIGLVNFVIPESVTSIGEDAFNNCEGLVSITIPKGVISIGTDAFVYCENLASIVVASENMVYDSRNNCNAIIETSRNALIAGCMNTIIPDSVVAIGPNAFAGQSNLRSIIIPESVTSIGGLAFYECTGLTSIDIPKSVTSIGVFAFNVCRGLTSITVRATTPPTLVLNDHFSNTNECPIYVPWESVAAYKSAWGVYASRIQAIPPPNNIIYYTSSDGKVVTPTNTDVFGAGYISNEYVNGVGVITFNGDVSNIGFEAFVNCHRLTAILLPNSVTKIDTYAFMNCEGLKSFEFPNSVTSIGTYAFLGCDGLTAIRIPASVISISGTNPFSGCEGLISIIVDSGNVAYDSRENCNAIIETQSNSIVSGCRNSFIPNSVKSIGTSAFAGSHLTSIDIPNSVKLISYGAFCGCDNTSLFIPSTVTSILDNPFYGCRYLSTVAVDSGNPEYDSRDNCNAIIQTSTNELISGCKSTVIPYSVKSIGKYAFRLCEDLISIEIPSKVSYIGDQAFYGCMGLKAVLVKATQPPLLGTYVFGNDYPIYVPDGAVDAYKSSWSEYADRIRSLADYH